MKVLLKVFACGALLIISRYAKEKEVVAAVIEPDPKTEARFHSSSYIGDLDKREEEGEKQNRKTIY
ncbi:hypothetical protein ACFSKU_06260 [Pontibacter silvestris]|uniref:Uncharacterized protein n=1 Tax=Pontibacter silvestris TaxID=2305183 RepID=A0ABW4WUS0_9BACT|nr:hypothetical protein [Pontibacter silvestris]MCC9136437.1 hypothetical protein [Pontibacter silvestris]